MIEPPLIAALDQVAAELADPAAARQFELEVEMIEQGRHKFWDHVSRARPSLTKDGRLREREESRAPTSQGLMRIALNPVRDGIIDFLRRAGNGGAGRRPMAVKRLALIEPEVAAFLAVKLCLDAFSLSLSQTSLCIRLGRAIEDEVRIRVFEAKATNLLAKIRERFTTSSSRHHRRVLNALARRHDIDLGEHWPETEALHVGAALLTQVIERTGLFELVTEQSGGQTRSIVQPTAATLAWVRKREAAAQFLLPAYMPLIIKPRPWTTPTDGGYHYNLAGKLRLVKNRDRGYQSALRRWDMPLVYRAINALQDTPWSVNTDILPLMLDTARKGAALGGLPETTTIDVPPAPTNIPAEKEARSEEQQQRLVAWKSRARAIHMENLERRQKGLVLARTLAIAQKYAEEPALFFPYTLDFRGRAYPATSFLQPQGCDYQKALLRFSVGKPVGEQGAAWLAIHGANLMGRDPITNLNLGKLPLQARIDWVFANEARILAAAANPKVSDWWAKAGGPWQFLAFCHEWAGYAREGGSFRSHLPVALDGSCNGLQHFSAMLRDEVGGAAVNLVPHPLPADIYGMVRDRALTQVEADARCEMLAAPDVPKDEAGRNIDSPELQAARKRNADIAAARAWVASGQLDRELCKRPVMTMPYGSKVFGIKDQIMEEIRRRGVLLVDPATGEAGDGWNECGYMAKVIWQALGSVVVKAREAMDWLQTCAGLAAAEQQPINWVTPDGFWVQQDYRETHSRRVKSQVAGAIFWPRLAEESPTVSRLRQQNGVAPNFVHSMDGAAMRLCVITAMDMGIASFAMIHDSYATHAADTGALYACIRSSFIDMYSRHDVLKDFRVQLESQLSVESAGHIPTPPRPGTLDLAGVASCDFFFA
ncbi:DNA-directed RNA polymerase [Caulobacter segnis]|uniref:DNA-directed RNA polymerase n=1 Tax=Caulobacter segnis TaxID=88688 RepID=UPI0028597B90|nr:DNA-directed RNA polymerase [Caulobacter segnis]MDR6624337.1 DNA-directed RNA polymerase [Caulobacter segnis]